MISLPKDVNFSDTGCPMYHLLDLLGKKWTLFILVILFEGDQTFNSLTKKLNNINSKTLTERLDMLLLEGYICRQVSELKPIKVTYTLSTRGKELTEHIIQIGLWRKKGIV